MGRGKVSKDISNIIFWAIVGVGLSAVGGIVAIIWLFNHIGFLWIS